jgi:hypothetical protein
MGTIVGRALAEDYGGMHDRGWRLDVALGNVHDDLLLGLRCGPLSAASRAT